MSEDLGSAHGSVVINAASALATLAALRRSSAASVGSLNTVGRAAITGGMGVAAVGAGIAAVFALAVNKSAQLEKRISYIKGITGIHGKEVDVLREKIIQLGQDSAYTAQEVADGFTELSKAGATTQQLVGGVGDAMITLGQSADISLTDAATALVSISSTFDIAASKASTIADTLQGAANASIVSVEDMAVSFKYAGGVAANLGVSFKDTATAIAILGNAGIRGSTAGTSLRRIFLQLTPRTDKAAHAMKELGIITKDGSNRFYDAEGNAKSLAQITEILKTSTAGLTAEMKQKAFATIFGDRAINSAIALSKDGAKGFKKMKQVVGNVKAEDVAAERLNNLAGKWEILKGTIDSALIRGGGPAQKPLMELVVLITRLVNAFNNLSPATQTMIVRFALITAGLFLLVGGFLIVFGTILRAVAIFIQLANVMKIVMFNVKVFIALMRVMTASLLTNPVFLIIAAIVLLGVALFIAYKKSEKFRAIVDAVGRALKSAAIATWNFLKKVPGAVKDAWNATKDFFVRMYNAVAGFITGAINFVKNNWQKILFVLLTGPLGLAVLLIWKYKEKIISFMGDMVKKVIGFFLSLPGRIGFALGFIIGSILRFQIQVWTTLVTGTLKVITAVINFYRQLPGRIWSFLLAVIGFFNKWIPIVIAKAFAAAKGFYTTMINFWKQLPGRIWSFLVMIVQKLDQFRVNAWNKARAIGGGFKDAVLEGIKLLPGLVWDALQNVVQVFKDMIGVAFNAAKDFGGGLWKGFKKGLFGSPRTKIEYAIEDMGATVNVETDNLKKQMKTLQRYGAALSMSDSSLSARASQRSLATPAGSSSTTRMGDTIEINNINPARTRPEQSTERALAQVAYRRGYRR